MKLSSLAIALLVLAAAAVVVAQQAPAPPPEPAPYFAAPAGVPERVDIITPHITDSHILEIPVYGEYRLPRWTPWHVAGITVDPSPTKHVVMMLIAALLCLATMLVAARGAVRQTDEQGHTSGFAGAVETMVLFVRNEVVLPNVGPHGEGFAPFVVTLFFFILYANLLGLVPYGSTATGNISVTAMLATVTFLVIEGATIAALGWGYLGTIFYWPHDMSIWMKLPMTFIMTPVEFLGKFTKPFALAIRLFANMTAGHVVLLAFIGLIFTFQSWYIAPLPALMGVGVSLLEVLVAFLQAFIFALLASVFIGLGRQAAH